MHTAPFSESPLGPLSARVGNWRCASAAEENRDRVRPWVPATRSYAFRPAQ